MIDGCSTQMFMALAPAPCTVDVEHVFLVLLEWTNHSTRFPATHNYKWISQTQFDPCKQLQKIIHAQQARLSNRRFLVIDGLYQVDWNTKISNVLSPKNNKTAEHLSTI